MSSAEYLESGRGEPQPPRGRRTVWLVGGAVGVLAVVGAGAWAAWSFFSTGPQPAEALPASTIVYASIDLDPGGAQKIEALRTLREFPSFKDDVGLETDDDVREWLFDQVKDSSGCDDLDYGDDVEPWLGDRMALAAVDTGEDGPAGVVVVQVSDEDAAEKGLTALRDCGGTAADGGGDSDSSSPAWSVHDGWAVLGETQDVVDRVTSDTADAPLSDDADFQHWTDETGGGGIATLYVARSAADLAQDELGGLVGSAVSDDPTTSDALDSFRGMAATLRFSDGSLELEMAGGSSDAADVFGDGRAGDDLVATLPSDTAAAVGVGLADGWLGDLVDDDTLAELSDFTGLDLPSDVETLTGRSVALAVGADLDPDTLENSEDGTGVPVGLKVEGDAEAIGKIVDRLGPPFDSDSDGDVVAVGPDADYRQELLDDGGLGKTNVYQRAVPDSGDAAMVVFVDFDAGTWLDQLVADDDELAADLEPLQALGISAWTDEDTTHVVMRVTTD